MTEEYKRQTNDLFYNVVSQHKDISTADLNSLLAMQTGLAKIIEERKQQEFEVKVKAIKDAVKALKKDYPCATAYVILNANYEDGEELDLMDYFENAHFEP